MKYFYYIIGIIVVVSGLSIYGLMGSRVELSTPVLKVNDRIITRTELEAMMELKPYYMSKGEYIDSVITRQLLIQEAVRQKINKEEPFRQSVENYYEQSLIKILLDRKLKSIKVNVSETEIQRYQQLMNSRVKVSKFGYKNKKEAIAQRPVPPQSSESDFMDLSEDLKFVLLNLETGERSMPIVSGMGVLVYRLDRVTPIQTSKPLEIDLSQVTGFLRDRKREVLMDEWTRDLKENAEIWRENESTL